ncbi:MAG TPA: acyl-CoA dehydrogenase family protein [Longimicrobiales bacterium]
MPDTTFLRWPFFDDTHRAVHWGLTHWRVPGLGVGEPTDVDAESRRLCKLLGEGGWLRYVVPAEYGGLTAQFDVRSLCLIRETLAYQSGLADFVFAMQGLGTGAITLFGSDELKRHYLPRVAQGEAIAAFAISEAEAGSDVGAMQSTAAVDGDGWVINGEKTWISNAGIADHYVVFCRIPDGGEKSYGAFVIDADNPGLAVTERIQVIAPHVLGTLRFQDCRVPASAVIGAPGAGLKIALATLDVFRTTVAAAALGFARRALDEAVTFTRQRKGFGKTIADMQMTQARIAEMGMAVDAAALLVYRAAWAKDNGETRITREAAMAKLFATEAAQKIIDDAVQLHGGRGVVHGEVVERLYREIRALRIYEGTSEIQKIVIAGQIYAGAANA